MKVETEFRNMKNIQQVTSKWRNKERCYVRSRLNPFHSTKEYNYFQPTIFFR